MDSRRLTFTTFGSFRVAGPDGHDLTPRGQKACGVLALLAAAPGHVRSRAALQDKLWSDRGQEQGGASLRQALSEIRKAFGEHRDVLEADARQVWLRRDAVASDIADPAAVAKSARAGAVFLEGIGIRDPEFEDWLRDRRLAFDSDAAPAAVGQAESASPVLILAAGEPGKDALFAQHLVHSIAKNVTDWGTVDVRWDAPGMTLASTASAFRLEGHERPLGDGAALRLQLTDLTSGRIRWQTSDVISAQNAHQAGIDLSRLVNEGTNRTVAILAGAGPRSLRGADGQGFAALRQLFSTSGRNPEELHARFAESFERDGRGIHLACQAFLICFVVGERRGGTIAQRTDARRLLKEAIEIEPHNPLILAFASHVHGFVLREFAIAHELAERSVMLDRGNCFGWAFLGVAKLNLGSLAEAYTCIVRARQLAGEGPHRLFLDSVGAMVGSLTGHTDEAIGLGETAHTLQPGFAPPLRYLIASYLSSGDNERARLTALRLRALEPDFDTSLFADPDYPVEPLRRSGLLNLKAIPRLL